MKRILANFFLKLATQLGARRVCVQVIKDGYTAATADAVLTKANWQADSAAALAKFLTSDDGVLLSNRLRTVAAAVAINGAQDRTNTVHAAGVSAGWNECVRYFFSLSRVSGDQDTKPHAEQTPQDEASLLEILSP